MQRDRVLMMLGLARKAGQIASGGYAVEKAVKEGRASLVIAAEDASDNAKKKLKDMTSFYNTELIFYGTKETLAKSIGEEYRTAAAVLSEDFARQIRLRLDEYTTE